MPGQSSDQPKKNTVSIRLMESAVFLRTDGPSVRPSRNADTRASMLRGLLVLELAKPTKITSIDLELVATASTAWPDGARRIEVTEEHRVFQAATVYFRANKSMLSTRRAVSMGPGVTFALDDHDYDWDDLDDEETEHSLLRTPRGEYPAMHASADHTQPDNTPANYTSSPLQSPLDRSPQAASPRSVRSARRVSVDSHYFQRTPISHHEEYMNDIPIPPYSPLDPSMLLPSATSPASSSSQPTHNSGQSSPTTAPPSSLEEPVAPLPSSSRAHQRSQSTSNNSSGLSLRPSGERSVSRRPSARRPGAAMHGVPEEESQDRAQLRPNEIPNTYSPPPQSGPRPTRSLTPSTMHSRSGSASASESVSREDLLSRSSLNLNENAITAPMNAQSNGTAERSNIHNQSDNNTIASTSTSNTGRDRRRHSMFSFSAVADAFKDVMHTASPRTTQVEPAPREREGDGLTGLGDRDRSRDESQGWDQMARGRTMDRRTVAFGEGVSRGASITSATATHASASGSRNNLGDSKSHHRAAESGGIFAAAFGDTKEKKEVGNGWKEFKKGTYTYPISFSIPSTAPPTLQCDYGSVVWRLNANVHRPGTFKPKLSASRDVLVIASPTEEDTEDTENIIVERHWEQQLQYLISISGRSFPIGGTVPVSLVLMPLAKVKIYRLSVYIEERVDYYTRMRRIARSDPIVRYDLLSVKHEGGKHAPYILPLVSDDIDAVRKSPLYPILSREEDESEAASTLMGPGPWSFHQDLRLPDSCDQMHFTNKNRRANMTVSHLLKIVIRVERGDDLYVDKSGKRKMFDIVVQTPVQILSCRCSPEWTSLPRYSETFNDDTLIIPNCPCQVRRMAAGNAAPEFHLGFRTHLPTALERIASRQSSDSSNSEDAKQTISTAETNAVDPAVMRSLRQSHNAPMVRTSEQFERLVSGFETELGEAPPAYALVDVPTAAQPPVTVTS